MSEHDEQVALFEWAAYAQNQHPALRLMFAIPNGGHRHKAVAAKLKAEGVKAGVLDVFLPVSRGGYHGLWVEMKFKKNKPSPEQKQWLDDLDKEGFLAVVCWSFYEAKDAVESYILMDSS